MLETPRLRADRESLNTNEEIFKEFVERLPEIGLRVKRDDTQVFSGMVSAKMKLSSCCVILKLILGSLISKVRHWQILLKVM